MCSFYFSECSNSIIWLTLSSTDKSEVSNSLRQLLSQEFGQSRFSRVDGAIEEDDHISVFVILLLHNSRNQVIRNGLVEWELNGALGSLVVGKFFLKEFNNLWLRIKPNMVF